MLKKRMTQKDKGKIKENEFRCANCGGVFEKGWSDEEAREEAKQWTKEEMASGESVICDDCYTEFMNWRKAND